MKGRFLFLTVFFLFLSKPVFSWGPTGHKLVALIARSQLDREVIANVDFYLKGMTWEEAACWMDEVQREPKYEYMKTWHYVNIEKDKTYVQTKEFNVVNKLEYCLRMLQYKTYQTEEIVNETLRLLFHLVGDLHQPLHCGYASDRGGNEVKIYMIAKETNLHKLWDSDIIENKRMDMWHCAKALVGMKLTAKKRAALENINVQEWMAESRALLPSVYPASGNKVDERYIDDSALIIEVQLMKAGLRLAAVLKKYFS